MKNWNRPAIKSALAAPFAKIEESVAAEEFERWKAKGVDFYWVEMFDLTCPEQGWLFWEADRSVDPLDRDFFLKREEARKKARSIADFFGHNMMTRSMRWNARKAKSRPR